MSKKSTETLHSPTAMAILPGECPQLCPELLTEEEAIRYLRLDLVDTEDPTNTLRYRPFVRTVNIESYVPQRTDLDRLTLKFERVP